MTVYVIDIHPTFQADLDPADVAAAGVMGLICKVTEGSGWYRAGYHDKATRAKQAGLLFSAYHFLRSESSGASQAAWTKQCMGSDWGDVPVMLDWETSVSGTKALASTAVAYINEVRRLGGKCWLNYLPKWYWSQIGQPSLATGVLSTLDLIQSSYGDNPSGPPGVLYPGDTSPRWNGFGGVGVDLLQFGSNCRIPGYGGPLDINARRFTTTRIGLAATGWFYDPRPDNVPDEQGDATMFADEFNNPNLKFKVPSDLIQAYHDAGYTGVDANSSNTPNRLAWLADLRGVQATKTARDLAVTMMAFIADEEIDDATVHQQLTAIIADIDAMEAGTIDVEALALSLAAKLGPAQAVALAEVLGRTSLQVNPAP